MIDKQVIENCKSASLVKVVESFGFRLKKQGTEMVMNCCFHTEDSPSFKIDTTANFYKCFGCGESGDTISFVSKYRNISFEESVKYIASLSNIQFQVPEKEKTYKPPVQKNVTQVSDKMLAYFKSRGISQQTVIKLKVTQSLEKMYEHKHKITGKVTPAGERVCINFNYYKEGELVNIKFRDGLKCFKLSSGAELILFNLDSCKDAKTVFITEGEMDAATLVECDIWQKGVGVTSVPNGANIKGQNMAYIDNSIDSIDPEATIILATDDDIAGRKLREDLSLRFGKERCKYLTYDGLKDLNDVLVQKGREAVLDCINQAKSFPLEGVYSVTDYSDEIDDLYQNGLEIGDKTGCKPLDDKISWVRGYITTITGIPSHGKSGLVDFISVSLAVRHGWKFGFYSPENKPTKLHFSKLAKILIGKPFDSRDKRRMNTSELNAAKKFFDSRFFFLKPAKDFTIDTILAQVKGLKARSGIDAFVIDAWNRLEHKYSGTQETKYIGETLVKIANFCELNKVHCFLVAHPAKAKKNPTTGTYEVQTLYDISGSANFYNMTDNGLSVYRDFVKGTTEVHVQKVKFDHWGSFGMLVLKYDRDTGRYAVADNSIPYDTSNWLETKPENTMEIFSAPSEPEGNVYIKRVEDGDDFPF